MKPYKLNYGDKVGIVSLSSGALGEDWASHELDLGVKRLAEFGLEAVIMPNACKGISYLKSHPEKRAQDLVDAFNNKEIKGIICAIGGDDTYRLFPYLMENAEFISAVKNNPKLFMGFSDSTINHLMLNSLGLNTFYGPALLTDFAELDNDMLGYTKYWVLNLFVNRKTTKLESSSVWYKERTDFSPNAIGTMRDVQLEENGFIKLCGGGIHEGKLYGGCIDSIYSIFNPQNKSQKEIFEKYKIFNPPKGAMLFLETSDNKVSPDEFRKMLLTLKQNNVFKTCEGVLFGKPQDQVYMDEYNQIIKEELGSFNVLSNLNFGHAYPRCIMPYNISCKVDFDKKSITLTEPMFEVEDILK